MYFHNAEVEAKYRRLGFQYEGLGMRLQIGDIDIKAVEHTEKGVAMFLTCFTPRTICQLETCAPTCASIEQIACLIYVNVVGGMKHQGQACVRYFRSLKLSVFQ